MPYMGFFISTRVTFKPKFDNQFVSKPYTGFLISTAMKMVVTLAMKLYQCPPYTDLF